MTTVWKLSHGLEGSKKSWCSIADHACLVYWHICVYPCIGFFYIMISDTWLIQYCIYTCAVYISDIVNVYYCVFGYICLYMWFITVQTNNILYIYSTDTVKPCLFRTYGGSWLENLKALALHDWLCWCFFHLFSGMNWDCWEPAVIYEIYIYMPYSIQQVWITIPKTPGAPPASSVNLGQTFIDTGLRPPEA